MHMHLLYDDALLAYFAMRLQARELFQQADFARPMPHYEFRNYYDAHFGGATSPHYRSVRAAERS